MTTEGQLTNTVEHLVLLRLVRLHPHRRGGPSPSGNHLKDGPIGDQVLLDEVGPRDGRSGRGLEPLQDRGPFVRVSFLVDHGILLLGWRGGGGGLAYWMRGNNSKVENSRTV